MKLFSLLATAATALALASAAQAAVVQIGTQGAFTAAGAITQNTNWDAYGTGFTTPGNNFVVGDMTFVEGGQNLIGGVGGYGMLRPLFTDNFVAGTTILIAGLHNLFGLNAGNFFGTGPTTFTLTTNLGAYVFNDIVDTATGQAPLSFHGFQAGPGEYFTSVAWSSAQATGVTDVQLGAAAGVPEPATWALMISGFGLAGASLRRRRTVAA